MFDVGFSEIIVIGVVALLVLGPERLPKLARDIGRWIGRARRYANRVREEIDREVELNELRRLRDEIETRAREVAGQAESAQVGVEEAVRSTLDEVAQPQQPKQSGAAPAVAVDTSAAKRPATSRRRRAAADAGAPQAAAEDGAAVVAASRGRKRASSQPT